MKPTISFGTRCWVVLALCGTALSVNGEDLATSLNQRPVGCGEVCVQLLAHAYERPYDQAAIRSILLPGKVGETSMARLRDAIAALQLDARVVKGNMETLLQTEEPVVLFLHKRDGSEATGHFVILKTGADGAPIILDPYASDQPIPSTPEEISKFWTGYAILVSAPASSFRWQWWQVIACSFGIGAVTLLGMRWFPPRRTSTVSTDAAV